MDFFKTAKGSLRRIPGHALAAAVLFYLWAVNIAVASAAEFASVPRTLEWKELVPPGWEPPVIAPAYGEANENLVDSASLVGELNGLVVKMPGFLRPVLFNDRSVTEFLLVPFLPHHIKQHAHLEPNQMVYVVLDRPVEIENPFEPLWVTGIISLQTVVTDEGPSGYKIINAEVQEYVY